MTTLETIDKLNFFDFLRKLKVILTDLLTQNTGDLPTYASNATALAGGLKINDRYKTAGGEIRIVV